MATQQEIDAWKALVVAGEYDQARSEMIAGFPTLFYDVLADVLVNGTGLPTLLTASFSESWNVHLLPATSFGTYETTLVATPTAGGTTVSLPGANTTFVPPNGYRFLVKNADGTNAFDLDPDGAATIDGASTLAVPASGVAAVFFDGINYTRLY